ncbi:hypothetical protein H6F89_01530 [Cyanobacteria bacterium FACHB-63]|nr:hypothetical protein [Cyanobacteria bacterium FACHB-63]
MNVAHDWSSRVLVEMRLIASLPEPTHGMISARRICGTLLSREDLDRELAEELRFYETFKGIGFTRE